MALFGKKKEQGTKTDSWKFEDFKNFFEQEAEKKGNSMEFQTVAKALSDYEAVRSQPASRESAMKLIEANQALISACETYANERKGALTGSGKARLDAVRGLVSFQSKQNLDEIRDLRVVRGFEGKTWEQVGPIPTAEITVSGKTEKVGANVSQRLKVEYGGKKGFFTASKEMKSLEGSLTEMTEQIDKKTEPERRKAFEENRENLLEAMKAIPKKDDRGTEAAFEGVSRDAQKKFRMADAWNRMETGGATAEIRKQRERQKEEFGKAVLADEKGFKAAWGIMDSYHQKLKEEGKDPRKIGSFRRKLLLEQSIGESTAAGADLKRILSENDELLLNMPAPETGLRRNVVDFMTIKGELIQKKAALDTGSKAGRKSGERMDLLINDDKTIHDLAGMREEALSMDLASGNSHLKLDAGNELASRNVASSRMAELLGLGNLIAHSRKMVIHTGDKTLDGCFMEFAEGIDLNSQDYEDQKKISQIGEIRTPEFNRAAFSMEVLDRICGQTDRHGKNMFYQLSEPDENGKRSIVGIQGIDNDLAFNDEDGNKFGSMNLPEFDVFIDRQLAERIRGIDRASLEFAVGDLLPKDQIDGLEARVQSIQERLNTGKMVELNPDEWALDEYNFDDYRQYWKLGNLDLSKTDLDARGKAYVQGLLSLEKSQKGGMGYKHKNTIAEGAFRAANQAREAYEASQDELYSGVQEMMKEEKEPEKAAAAKTAENKTPVREKVGLKGLEKPALPARRNMAQAAKKRPEMQEKKEQKQPERGMSGGRR